MTLQDLLTESEYAAARGVSVRTVQRERALRIGPAFIKLGKRIYYRPEAVDAWILSQERTPAGKAA
ncbi:AlpA family transcriptional regulator [Tabrizicola sp. YIM 78059]|uniref:helix-turn-helix transcriptional regulator n=1 Tax=Tabrizicola sp. YIM 78059 TaxID=2529861 RepID=UPI0010AB4559|nr:helix-turn-helix domain-containing protein [Tabrizicola sp. YIM 78059]